MPGYRFDQTLVPSVLADAGFRRSGLYAGSDRGLFYAVADPRRRKVDVWPKVRTPILGLVDQVLPWWSYGKNFIFYRLSAIGGGFLYFTNGPMMSPPPSTGGTV